MIYEIFSKPGCSYCEEAKKLLSSAGLSYTEAILDMNQEKEAGVRYYTVAELQTLVPGVRSVPQIFAAEDLFEPKVLIGGFEALKKHLA